MNLVETFHARLARLIAEEKGHPVTAIDFVTEQVSWEDPEEQMFTKVEVEVWYKDQEGVIHLDYFFPGDFMDLMAALDALEARTPVHA